MKQKIKQFLNFVHNVDNNFQMIKKDFAEDAEIEDLIDF